jgi:signal transduction histidine kinase
VANEAIDQRHLLLATLPPSQRQIRTAVCVAVALLVGFVVTTLYADVQLTRVDAVIPIIATATVFNDLTTSVLLFSQFSIVRRRALSVLASAYLFSALIVIPWALAFPGVFAPTGLLGAGLQTTGWLYFFWHAGAPLILIVATLMRDLDNIPGESKRSPIVAVGLSIATVIASVCGLTWVAISGNRFLPRLLLDGVHFNQSVTLITASIVTILDTAALALLWVRRRSVLDLWLMVVCCAWLFEIVTSTLIVTARFSLGFYVGRLFGLIATFVVLLVLLSETLALYANLARSITRQRIDRNSRQITMDAMAASIAHEVSQPLTSMVSNASSALLLMTRTIPDLSEARASIEDIIDDGRRASKIIGDVRSMFKKGAHGRQSIDINDLMREVITMIDLDLRTHRVLIATDLRTDLPQLLADRGQLQQVFLNLITNAIEAMDSVGGRARVLRVRSNMIQGSSNILVSVEDSGTGIEGDKGRVFESFYTTKSAGTGIGLAVCKSIIESHRGSLRASANKPFGTIFEVTLPTGDM